MNPESRIFSDYKKAFLRGGAKKLGPEMELTMLDHENPWAVPTLQKIDSFFVTLAQIQKPSGSVPVHEEIMINGKATRAYHTGVTFNLEGHEVLVNTDLSRCTVETSVPPSISLEENERHLGRILESISKAASESGLAVLGLGAHPLAIPMRSNIMPKPRYLALTGVSGKEVLGMGIISATQHHVDASLSDAARIANVLNGATPAMIAATANSTVIEGKVIKEMEFRGTVWDSLVGDGKFELTRTGIPARRFTDVDDWLRYLTSHRPVITKRRLPEGEECLFFGRNSQPFIALLRAGGTVITERPCGRGTAEIELGPNDLNALNGHVWPDVRLTGKGTVEFRPCALQPSLSSIMAIGALVKGLANNSVEADAYLMKRGFTPALLISARRDAIRCGFGASIGSSPLAEVGIEMLGLAKRGLALREEKYLEPLRRNFMEEKNPALRTREWLKDAGCAGSLDNRIIGRFIKAHELSLAN